MAEEVKNEIVSLCWHAVKDATSIPVPRHEDDMLLLDCTAHAGEHFFLLCTAAGTSWSSPDIEDFTFEDAWEASSSYLHLRWCPPRNWITTWNALAED